LQVLTPAAAVGALVMWVLAHAGWAAAPVAALAVAGLVATIAAWAMSPVPVSLSWDGQRWAADGSSGRLEVMIDLGPWLLLRLCPQPVGRACWIGLASTDAGSSMHALRAAVYGRAPEPASGIGTAAVGGSKQPG
jgi:hypothetical protein